MAPKLVHNMIRTTSNDVDIWIGPIFRYLNIWIWWVLKLQVAHLYQYDFQVIPPPPHPTLPTPKISWLCITRKLSFQIEFELTKLLITFNNPLWTKSYVLNSSQNSFNCSSCICIFSLEKNSISYRAIVFMHVLQNRLYSYVSQCMKFPIMWYVQPAKPQISLPIRAVWSEPLLVAWIFYEC